jgi:hypothetical protein
MSTVADEVAAAYGEIRSDTSDITWLLISYDGTALRWNLLAKGSGGFDELKANLTDTFAGMAYYRVNNAADRAAGAKFVLITIFGKGAKIFVKTKMGLHKGDIEKVLAPISASVQADNVDELTEEFAIASLSKLKK